MAMPSVLLGQGTKAEGLAQDHPSPMILDVALHHRATLIGHVIDVQGQPITNVTVSLHGAAGELAASRTNDRGNFYFSGLRNGVYKVAAPGAVGVYRVWSRGTAPPSARGMGLLVLGDNTVRGQNWIRSWGPPLTAGLVSAAISIPLAIADNKKPATP
jgi:hypothetical protein